jgi:parallel beta-helix repeat protein
MKDWLMQFAAIRPFVCALLILAAPAVAASQHVIEVSPAGPIKTLAEAREAERAQRKGGATGTITITIHAGTYFLPEALVLTPEDSNTTWEAAHGEHPVISGGRVIGGWSKGSDDIWTADAHGPYFYQLFVNGRRATRTRNPPYGFFRFEGDGASNKPMRLRYRGNDIDPAWANQPDTEIVGFMAWSDFRSAITSVDRQHHEVDLAITQGSADEPNARYYIENLPGALIPGKWYLDRNSQRVSYLPLPGENMDHAEVIAAGLQRLILLRGDRRSGRSIHDVTFRGLTLMHADWSPGANGLFDMQAAVPAPAAVQAIDAANLRVERCTFAHDGGYGLELGRGSQHNQVLANEFYDMGAGAIKVGTPNIDPDHQSENNIIADNQIHDLGQVYAAGIGIWVLQSSNNQIIHNHIHDTYETGISIGWTWGYGDSRTHDNLIAFNHIHSLGKEMLSDMGGIYTLGVQPGTVIRNNLIHDITTFTYGAWGIYLDEGSSNILVEDNVVYHCQSAGFHQHYGRDNILRNNIFAFNTENQLARTRNESQLGFTLEGNIIDFDQGGLLGGNWDGDGYAFRRNLYYAALGMTLSFAGKTFAEWQASGQDKDARVADPLFVDPGNSDFQLQPNSPALQMGFHQIDLGSVGPRRPAGATSW